MPCTTCTAACCRSSSCAASRVADPTRPTAAAKKSVKLIVPLMTSPVRRRARASAFVPSPGCTSPLASVSEAAIFEGSPAISGVTASVAALVPLKNVFRPSADNACAVSLANANVEPGAAVPFTRGALLLAGEGGSVPVIFGVGGGMVSTWNERETLAPTPESRT